MKRKKKEQNKEKKTQYSNSNKEKQTKRSQTHQVPCGKSEGSGRQERTGSTPSDESNTPRPPSPSSYKLFSFLSCWEKTAVAYILTSWSLICTIPGGTIVIFMTDYLFIFSQEEFGAKILKDFYERNKDCWRDVLVVMPRRVQTV